MIEVLWYGRGGQGAFTAARLLGSAYCLKDELHYALAFPSFGPERRGAPIRAFTKLAHTPINNRSEIEKADYMIFLDDTLYSDCSLLELKPDGIVIVNTKKEIRNSHVVTIDADSLANEILKKPITNTIMLGAFTALFDGVLVEDLERAIKESLPHRIQEKNIIAISAAANKLLRRETK